MSTRWHPLSLSRVRPDIPGASFRLKPKRASVIKFDFRLAWILPAAILFSLPFVPEGYYTILGSTLAAMVACSLAMASVGYSLTSFISLVALTHLLFYPLAVLGNLLLPKPLVRWDLWVTSDLAMWGCALGVLALGLGAFIANHLVRPSRTSLLSSRTVVLPSFRFNLFLVLLIVPVVFMMLFLGVYYHSAITDYNFKNNSYRNIIELMLYISHAGIFLQTFRYCRTRLPRDGYWAIAFCLIHIIIFMPSGSRTRALGFTPLLFLAYLSWASTASKKLMVLLSSLVLIPTLIYGIGHYRNIKNVETRSFNEKLDASLLAVYATGGQEMQAIGSVISRFSDYTIVGRVIAYTPDQIKYRGFEHLDELWEIFVPGFLAVIPDRIDLNDGAVLCDLYNVTTTYRGGGSSPIMIIGDLFTRWGWPGVLLGMAVIGFILRLIDLRILFRWDTFTIIFYVIFGRLIVPLVSTSLVNVFVMFTRDLLLMVLIAYLLARLSNLNPTRHNQVLLGSHT